VVLFAVRVSSNRCALAVYTEGEKAADSFSFWNGIALVSGIAEDLLLYALTMVSSTEDPPVHENSFILFMFFAHLHFLTFLIAYRKARYASTSAPLDTTHRLTLMTGTP
jgi:hypothetical protein